jgi:hypothetical protein
MRTVLAAVIAVFCTIPFVDAAEKVAADKEARPVVDGAKNPELIPDYQAYHLVLMVASAAEDAPEVEKERAKAVRAMILGPTDTDADLPALAEVANHHRKTLTGYIAESKRGNTDAERLKSEHLGRVKAEAELRLPAAARKALADYVKAEKANMKIHGKDQKQIVAMPELLKPGTGIGALGYCDGGSGGLAPYCRDGCSGARPCDKRCRRDDESCTTCGNYGVCCCLGGPTPTPTPTPTSPPPPPPSGGMSGEPTGTVYQNITPDDNLVVYVTAITNTAPSCTCHSSRASIAIYAPWASRTSSSGLTGAYAETTTGYQTSVPEFDPGADLIVETSHESFCPIRAIWFLNALVRTVVPVQRFVSRFVYWSYFSDPEPHGPDSMDGYAAYQCVGRCMGYDVQRRKHSLGHGHTYFERSGLTYNLRIGRVCKGTERGRDYKPECIQP